MAKTVFVPFGGLNGSIMPGETWISHDCCTTDKWIWTGLNTADQMNQVEELPGTIFDSFCRVALLLDLEVSLEGAVLKVGAVFRDRTWVCRRRSVFPRRRRSVSPGRLFRHAQWNWPENGDKARVGVAGFQKRDEPAGGAASLSSHMSAGGKDWLR